LTGSWIIHRLPYVAGLDSPHLDPEIRYMGNAPARYMVLSGQVAGDHNRAIFSGKMYKSGCNITNIRHRLTEDDQCSKQGTLLALGEATSAARNSVISGSLARKSARWEKPCRTKSYWWSRNFRARRSAIAMSDLRVLKRLPKKGELCGIKKHKSGSET
jgi:hypothetical protein